VALGLKNAPRCLACLARGLERPVPELREDLAQFVRRRDCYRRAWDVASEREGMPLTARPPCLWPEGETSSGVVDAPAARSDNAGESSLQETWDAGGMACGDLVMALRGRLNQLPPGVVLKVTARDPAAPEDLPAWCRLTGNRLLRAAHPDYFIQRKEV
jgi:tRNA 2-thiouridine synthesizing protein A